MTRLRRERSRSYLGRSARLRSLDQGSLTEVSRETDTAHPPSPTATQTAQRVAILDGELGRSQQSP
jgi:hypothetical protein